MRRMLLALALLPALFAFSFSAALAGDAEVKAAQATIDSQLKAFIADDNAAAYSYAAPNVKQIFPTLDSLHEHGDQRLQAGAEAAELHVRQGCRR